MVAAPRVALLVLLVLQIWVTSISAFSLSPKSHQQGKLHASEYLSHRCDRHPRLLVATQPFTTTSLSVYALGSADSGHGNVEGAASTKNALLVANNVRRQVTGFSVSALRTTVRTATGISLTALYASTVAISGAWMRHGMKVFLSLFPSWARYFVQPILVLYYVPLYMLKSLSSPRRMAAAAGSSASATTSSGSKSSGDALMSYKPADMSGSDNAEVSSSYWPTPLDSK